MKKHNLNNDDDKLYINNIMNINKKLIYEKFKTFIRYIMACKCFKKEIIQDSENFTGRKIRKK